MKKMSMIWSFIFLMTFALVGLPQSAMAASEVMWINHLDFLPGDPSVETSFNAVSAAGGLSGLQITSTTVGNTAQPAGNKVVEKGIQVPPGYLVTGVRVCYSLTNSRSFIDQTRIAQLQNPPSTALVLVDDGTDLNSIGPVCVDNASLFSPANQNNGALRLSFRVNFGDVNDLIVLLGVGLHVVPDPNSPVMQELQALREDLEELREDFLHHNHVYLTGKGVGHNNTQAMTTEPVSLEPTPTPLPATKTSSGKKKK